MKTSFLRFIFKSILSAWFVTFLFFSHSSAQLPGCHAGFTFVIDTQDITVAFTDTSWFDVGPQNTTWFWDFGDGITSNGQNPTHTYPVQQAYAVCLTVTNCSTVGGASCSDEACDTIYFGKVINTFLPSASLNAGLLIYPNPFSDRVTLSFPSSVSYVMICDIQGRILQKYHITGSSISLSEAELPPGIYPVEMVNQQGIIAASLLARK